MLEAGSVVSSWRHQQLISCRFLSPMYGNILHHNMQSAPYLLISLCITCPVSHTWSQMVEWKRVFAGDVKSMFMLGSKMIIFVTWSSITFPFHNVKCVFYFGKHIFDINVVDQVACCQKMTSAHVWHWLLEIFIVWWHNVLGKGWVNFPDH